MNKQINLSERDKKLLLLLFFLLMIAASYFFIYQPTIKKANTINHNNNQLKNQLNELTKMEEQSAANKVKIISFHDKTEKIKAKFPAGLNIEDTIIMVDSLEKASAITISSLGFKMNEVFYPAAVNSSNHGTSDETNVSASSNNLTGYKSTITITYKSSYAGLKKAINFINQNPSRMTLDNMTAVYDNSTGNLSGNIAINMFSLADKNKLYVEPFINNISTGRSNIFGTVEKQK